VAPPFRIHTARNTGRTDNSGEDSLWVVELSENGHEPENFRFAILGRHGTPHTKELTAMIGQMASGFDNYRDGLQQFRAREVAHPQNHPWRRVIWLALQLP
jgi:hypothetical protein